MDITKSIDIELKNTLSNLGIETEVAVISSRLYDIYQIVPNDIVMMKKLTSSTMQSVYQSHFNNQKLSAYQDGNKVVIEIPKKDVIVKFDDISSDDKNSLLVPIGVDMYGNNIYTDLVDAPHMLIAGTTGSGKSVEVKSIVTQLLKSNSQDNLHMTMIDPKQVEFMVYNRLNNVDVVTSAEDAMNVLSDLCDEMDIRSEILKNAHISNIEEYNGKMNYEIVVIDEFSDLMSRDYKNDTLNYVLRLAQMGRFCGIHLIIATQHPLATIIPTSIRGNLPVKICLQVPSMTQSRVILDTKGAEMLNKHGDLLFVGNGETTPIRCQAPLITREEIESIVRELSKLNKENDVKIERHKEEFSNEDFIRQSMNIINKAERRNQEILERRNQSKKADKQEVNLGGLIMMCVVVLGILGLVALGGGF